MTHMFHLRLSPLRTGIFYLLVISASHLGGLLPLAAFGIWTASLIPGLSWLTNTIHVSIMFGLWWTRAPLPWWIGCLALYIVGSGIWLAPQLSAITSNGGVGATLVALQPILFQLALSSMIAIWFLKNSNLVTNRLFGK